MRGLKYCNNQGISEKVKIKDRKNRKETYERRVMEKKR